VEAPVFRHRNQAKVIQAVVARILVDMVDMETRRDGPVRGRPHAAVLVNLDRALGHGRGAHVSV
jgi:hypothetical protein